MAADLMIFGQATDIAQEQETAQVGFAAESRLKEYMTKFRAAVIGLGQAGSRFDEENRGACWSHVGAYLELNNDFELVAGIDPAEDNRKKFELRCPGIAVLDNLDLLQEFKPDVVSIATPHHVRLSVFESLIVIESNFLATSLPSSSVFTF